MESPVALRTGQKSLWVRLAFFGRSQACGTAHHQKQQAIKALEVRVQSYQEGRSREQIEERLEKKKRKKKKRFWKM